MRAIKPLENIAWMCIEDFNEILIQNEKYGPARRPYGQMEDFRATLEECRLSDLRYKGDKYTWYNNREGSDFTKERLD